MEGEKSVRALDAGSVHQRFRRRPEVFSRFRVLAFDEHEALKKDRDAEALETWPVPGGRVSWCLGSDSNRHPFRDQILSLAWLPITPPRLRGASRARGRIIT
jgi:hypothetical protein